MSNGCGARRTRHEIGTAAAALPAPMPERRRAGGAIHRPFVLAVAKRYTSAMRHDPLYQPITVEQFLDIDFGTDRKFELVDGVIRMMTGGTPAHSRVATNLVSFLHQRLRGTGCRAYNSDMGVRLSDQSLRYPDVSVYCGNPATPEREEQRAFVDPVVIFEVLSASTAKIDEGTKLEGYRELRSVDTIVFVDPENELTRIVQRLGPTSWRDDLFAQPHDVALPALNLTIPHTEIFARD